MRPALLALALASALTVSGAPAATAGDAQQSTYRSAPSAAAPATDTDTVTFAFGGDTHFERGLAAYAKPGASVPGLATLLGGADVAMVNLETAVTTRGVAQPKMYRFRAPASALDALARSGVDVVTMANNHAVDYGPVGLRDTLAARASHRSAIGVVGVGANVSDAFAPWVKYVRSTRVAVFGATSISDLTTSRYSSGATKPGVANVVGQSGLTRLIKAVRAEHAKNAIVVVYLHWGDEHVSVPNAHQRQIATALVAAGAQIVVGSHAHELQGAGRTASGAIVAYGMGNFVWYNHSEFATSHSGVLRVSVTAGRVSASSFDPTFTSATGTPRRDAAALARSELRRLAVLAKRAGLRPLS